MRMLRLATGLACCTLALAACGEKDEPAATAAATAESGQNGDQTAGDSGSNQHGNDDELSARVTPIIGGGQGQVFPPPPEDLCEAALGPESPGTQNGPPPTIGMPARAWAVEEGVVRAMYPASGSNDPCELRIAEGPGGRVVIRVLNPRIATSDLRYWCVEARLPLAAPDIAPAFNLAGVDPSVRRQLRSGRGCVRVPYVPERPR